MRLLTVPTPAEEMKISYRQIDYWIDCGYISPTDIDGHPQVGSGNRRIFAGDNLGHARMFGRLIGAGWKPGKACSSVAWDLLRLGECRLPGGLTIRVTT